MYEYVNAHNHHAYKEGAAAKSVLDNPYWREYPNRSKKGQDDENAARFFVDGWCIRFRISVSHKEV